MKAVYFLSLVICMSAMGMQKFLSPFKKNKPTAQQTLDKELKKITKHKPEEYIKNNLDKVIQELLERLHDNTITPLQHSYKKNSAEIDPFEIAAALPLEISFEWLHQKIIENPQRAQEIFVYFIERGKLEKIHNLYIAGIDINAPTKIGELPLLIAISTIASIRRNNRVENKKNGYKNRQQLENNLYAIIELLLINNVDVNNQNCYGNTALHVAAGHFLPDIARLLLQFKARLSIRNNDGKTPLEYAQMVKDLHFQSEFSMQQYKEVVRVLQKRPLLKMCSMP